MYLDLCVILGSTVGGGGVAGSWEPTDLHWELNWDPPQEPLSSAHSEPSLRSPWSPWLWAQKRKAGLDSMKHRWGCYRFKTHMLRERKHLGSNDTFESMSFSKRAGLHCFYNSYKQDFGRDIAQLIRAFFFCLSSMNEAVGSIASTT